MKGLAPLLLTVAMVSGADTPEVPLVAGRDVPLPARTSTVAPIYPEAARAAGLEALILLRVTLATDGHPTAIKVLRGVPLLDRAAIEAVRAWRYEPTVVGGVPRRVELVEAVPLFPGDGGIASAFERLASDRSQPGYLRVAAISRLVSLPQDRHKSASKALQKLLKDGDEAVAKAAEAGLAVVGREAK